MVAMENLPSSDGIADRERAQHPKSPKNVANKNKNKKLSLSHAAEQHTKTPAKREQPKHNKQQNRPGRTHP